MSVYAGYDEKQGGHMIKYSGENAHSLDYWKRHTARKLASIEELSSGRYKFTNRLAHYQRFIAPISKALATRSVGDLHSRGIPTMSELALEIATVIEEDDNMLKRVACQEFARLAINVERQALEKKAEASRRDFAYQSRGNEARDEYEAITAFLAGVDSPVIKSNGRRDEEKKYSYHSILAEMELFLESNPYCGKEVRERIEGIRSILSSYYQKQPSAVEKKKDFLRVRYREKSIPEIRMARIEHLKEFLDDDPYEATKGIGPNGRLLETAVTKLLQQKQARNAAVSRKNNNPYEEI